MTIVRGRQAFVTPSHFWIVFKKKFQKASTAIEGKFCVILSQDFFVELGVGQKAVGKEGWNIFMRIIK